jgi:hypothetical protein
LKTRTYKELQARLKDLCKAEDLLLITNVKKGKHKKGEIMGSYSLMTGTFALFYGRIIVYMKEKYQAAVLIHELAHHFDYKYCRREFPVSYNSGDLATRDEYIYYRSQKNESLAFYVQDYLCNKYNIPQTEGRKFYQTPTSTSEKRKASFIISKIEDKLKLKEL